MTKKESPFEKAKRLTDLAAQKTKDKMNDLASHGEEIYDEAKPKLKDIFEKTQETAGLTIGKTNEKMKELGQRTNEKLEERKEQRAESKNQLEEAQNKVDQSVQKTNEKIEELGSHTEELFHTLTTIQVIFDLIRNVPTETKIELADLKKVRLNWKSQADKIDQDYQLTARKGAGIGALGTGAGIAVAALGPATAMGIATTFGVASTGTAISALSGAAATNAALAWLGGGALAAGGGGMVVGNILLALTGPVGWAVAGVAILSGGGLFLQARNEKEQLENIFTLISLRDAKSYQLAIVELNERIDHMINESQILADAIEELRDFGLDYNQMTDQQQHILGTYVNFMHSSTQLLVNPILGLQAKYSEADYLHFLSNRPHELTADEAVQFKEMIIFLANLLYKIELGEKDQKILWKTIGSNSDLLESMKLDKKEFKESLMHVVSQTLDFQYELAK